MYVGKRKSINGWFDSSEESLSLTKDILCSRSRLGWALVHPLCLNMVNTELFSGLSLGVRELVISMEFITLCLLAVWKHERQLTRFNREARELKGRWKNQNV